ncbi:MAG: hypothetical protein HY044_00370 [Candidatus Woesebacteria bacterium]|nr:MAG: hypothetical protein HY044_00370 [Candidatus Woesebacteria bacterium]
MSIKLKEWLYTDLTVKNKLRNIIDVIGEYWLFEWITKRMVKAILMRFPGFSEDEIYLAIAYAMIEKVSSSDKEFVLGYRTRKEADSLIQPYLNQMRHRGQDYFPEEDWLR